ncbi:hypothetical protein STPH2_7392 [Streptomyces sp. KO7888]|uniref:hypothetical protein n=1 Tax=Streptomyces sp. KO7888 TaxID=2602737 RepID=UPI0013F5F938|nr:hypothetical protein [Streptomyces sp. KO7888]NHI12022.1 hypothetical protein [Streptomyces sp. KO7888]
MNTPTAFKDRLASELSAMATATAPASVAAAPVRRLRVPLMAAGVATAAAAAAVILPSVSGSGASPAYAVTEEDDGSVIVDLNRPEGLPGLQKQLKELGIRAVAQQGDKDCAAGYPGGWALAKAVLTYPSDPGKVRIYPDRLPVHDAAADGNKKRIDDVQRPDPTLLLVADFEKDGTVRTLTDWVVNEVPSCSLPGRREG